MTGNPFMPGNIMRDPARFAGRDDLIREAHQYLSQGRSLFVAGRRGVGKSSFAAQVQQLVNGSRDAQTRFGIDASDDPQTNVTYRCDGTETLGNFANRLLHALERASGRSDSQGRTVSETVKVDLKLVSYQVRDESTSDISDVTTRFSEALIQQMHRRWFLAKAQVVLWIDEADLLIDKINIGVFLKVVLENLSDANVTQLRFVLVGISRGLTRLKAQHPSITRFLMPIYVPPMSAAELAELVDRALGPTPVVFEPEVREALYIMSQGFPDPVHLLGYELFEAARTNSHKLATPATFDDVLRKVTTSIKKEELHAIETRIPDQQCEKVLYSIAAHHGEHATTSDLAKCLEWPEERCRELCVQLCELQFLEQEGRKGFKFADPLFRVYLNMLEAQRDAEVHRAQMAAQMHYHLRAGNIASRMFNHPDTDRELLRVILDNYKRTGRSGMWS